MRIGLHALLLVTLVPSVAAAAPLPPPDESRSELTTRHGVGVTFGLGATSFIDRTARDLMGEGLAYYTDLRLIYGTRTRFAGEVAYTRAGRALPLAQRRAGGRAIYGHSFEGLLRLNHPGHRGSLHYAPFAVAGVGWTDFRPPDDRDPASATDLLGRVMILPVGVGCAFAYRVLYVEARFMYRATLGGESGLHFEGRPSMQAWFSGLSVGVEF